MVCSGNMRVKTNNPKPHLQNMKNREIGLARWYSSRQELTYTALVISSLHFVSYWRHRLFDRGFENIITL